MTIENDVATPVTDATEAVGAAKEAERKLAEVAQNLVIELFEERARCNSLRKEITVLRRALPFRACHLFNEVEGNSNCPTCHQGPCVQEDRILIACQTYEKAVGGTYTADFGGMRKALAAVAATYTPEAALRASTPEPVETSELEWQWRVSPQQPWTFASEHDESLWKDVVTEARKARASAPEPADASGMTPINHGWQPIATVDHAGGQGKDAERQDLKDRIEYALGAFRVIAAKECDTATARGFAQAGIDFLEHGEQGCAEIRGDPRPTRPRQVEIRREEEDEAAFLGRMARRENDEDMDRLLDLARRINPAPAPGRDVGEEDDDGAGRPHPSAMPGR